MADIGGAIKGFIQKGDVYLNNPAREAATEGWQLWINSATGQRATVVRQPDKNILQWKPGQAKAFSQYFDDLLFKPAPKDEPEERGMGFGEVSINWKPVYMPLIAKRVLPILAAYGVTMFLAGRYIMRKR